ncbi:MAG: hypothetical protein HY287_05365 [Planctomycetes bacterium]|nr:hypothetical protein [Planctomycetota bacterium]MBI3833739.1 hypothetical protein [Planctomycetota bacterium]
MKANAWFAATLFAIGSTGGCVSPANSPASSTTRIDQLKRFYRDLEGGRFVVLADFEDPKQMEIFQLANPNLNSKLSLDMKHGRTETGPGCMAFTPSTSDDAIVVSNANSQQWYLKRDWRPYNLLLVSVFSPTPSSTLDLTIATGQASARQSMHSASTLNRGWNLLRLDLAELGERLPLDDVQELRMRVEQQGKIQPCYFDDLLLVDSRQTLLGDAKGPAGDLYAVQAGRRLIVGAGCRFEMTFAHGQIVQWFNLAADPNRLVNLVEGTSLGPYPMPLEDAGEKITGTESKKPLAVQQRIVELNRVRIVIESDWLSAADSGTKASFLKWTHVVYPTGQIYVELSCDRPEALSHGIFVALGAPRTEDVEVTPSRTSESPRDSTAASWLLARIRSADAALLFVPSMNSGDVVLESGSEPDHRRVVLRAKTSTAPERSKLSAHLFLTTSSTLSNVEAHRRAADYNQLVPLRFEVGKAAEEVADTRRTDGFDAATGCFTIDADGGQARIVIDGRTHRLSSPAFRVRQTHAENAWIYVNHLILDRVERTEKEDVIFQITHDISEPTELEILTRGRSLPLTQPAK